MTILKEVPNQARRRAGLRCLLHTIPSAVTGTLVVWAVSRLGGVDLVVGTGADARTIGWLDVAVVSALAALAGTLLLVFMANRLEHGRRWWTTVATGVLLLSLSGPLGATTGAAVVTLAAMHVVVWLALVTTAWQWPNLR